VLRRIFGPKRVDVTAEWRRLRNKELYALYSSPNIIRVIKSRRLRWAGHVARMKRDRGSAYKVSLGKHEGRKPLGKSRCRWKDSIKMNLREVGWGHRLDESGSEWGQVACCCECVNEPSVCIKCGEFLDKLRNCQLLNKTSVTWSLVS
jgi:hypothetical protein